MSSISPESATRAATARLRVRALEAATYQRHPIHGDGRLWSETNCYTDLLVEMVHGFGFEPVAMLPCTLGIDFEGDQWTFFKPSHADLYHLYGIDVQELMIWRPIADHLVEMVGRGHPVMIELDSFYLPDTAGSAYKLVRNKSTVGVNEIDIEHRFMGYFHNGGYHELRDDDFRDVLMLEGVPHERMLPPYCEFWKWRTGYTPPRGPALVEASIESLKRNVTRIPESNPFGRFRERFAADLEWLLQADIERFHAYSFATLRQYGSSFELAETYVRWLAANGVKGLDPVVEGFHFISEATKALQFQLARSMARRKPLDLASLGAMGERWAQSMGALQARFG